MHLCSYLLSGEDGHPKPKSVLPSGTQFLKTGLSSCLQPITKFKQVFQIKDSNLG